ncbi:MAG TPA: hypothetical protein ACFYD1_04740, partial [Candidatus Hypogeohydataceae bacterium YC38]
MTNLPILLRPSSGPALGYNRKGAKGHKVVPGRNFIGKPMTWQDALKTFSRRLKDLYRDRLD